MMKRLLCVLALVLSSPGLFAAVRYEFRQTTRSDFQTMPPTDVQGKAIIDGDQSRVDFVSGSAYGPGSYMITSGGAQKLYIVNPTDKTYSMVDVAGSAGALGSSPITINNLKSKFEKLGDHPVIAGLPTEHYRMIATYDITVLFGTIPLTQGVETVIEKWVTTAFGDVGATFLLTGAPKTGNANLDKVLDAETADVKGLPLRQLITISTTSEAVKGRKSELRLSPTRKQTSEMVVTSVQALPVISPVMFQVPATYRRVDNIKGTIDQNPVTDLSMEPVDQ
ncbi:MAG: DUF4412 domain-containing protein [Acidobacteriota bacterium]